MEQLELAVVWSRVSKIGGDNSTKFSQTFKNAKEYCEGKGENRTGKKFRLHNHHYKMEGSAFQKDIRDGSEMKEIRGKIKDGTWQKPVNLIMANADRLDRREVENSLTDLLALAKEGFVIHEMKSGQTLDLWNKKENPNQFIMDVMYFMMVLQRAYEESLTKSKRAKDAHRARRENTIETELDGKTFRNSYNFSRPKWIKGWNEKKNIWEVDENEAFKIIHIFKQLLLGKTANQTSKELNELAKKDPRYKYYVYGRKAEDIEGDVERKAGERFWTTQILKSYYDNEGVTGTLTFNSKAKESKKVRVENYYPSIISKEEFIEVRNIVKSRARTGRVPYDQSIFGYLTKCYYCRQKEGLPSPQVRRKDFRNPDRYFFQCLQATMVKDCCSYSKFFEDKLQNVFLKYLEEVDLAKLLLPESGNKVENISNLITDINKQIYDLELEKKNLVVAVSTAPNVVELASKLNQCQDKLNDLEGHRANLEMEKDSVSNFAFTKKDQKEIANLDKLVQDKDNILKINMKLRRIINSIELAPNGLLINDPLSRGNYDLGRKKNRGELYGNKFPAFTINFKNGATRTIIFSYENEENALSIWKNGNNITYDGGFAFGVRRKMMAGDLDFLLRGVDDEAKKEAIRKSYEELKNVQDMFDSDEYKSGFSKEFYDTPEGKEFKAGGSDYIKNEVTKDTIREFIKENGGLVEGSKVCVRCNEKKSFEDFYKDSRKKDGRFSHCKKCDSLRNKGRKR
nr:recombinase [uncultured Mediterranean phage uvMED]